MSRSLLTLGMLLSIYLIIESFDKARYLGHGLTPQLMIEYMVMKIPFLISEFMPIIVLVGVSVYLIEISRHHEVVALRAAGLGTKKILAPLIMVATLAASSSFIIGEWIAPVTNQRLDSIEKVNIRHQPGSNQGIQWLRDEHRFFRLTPLTDNQFALTMIETDAKGHWTRRIDSSRASYHAPNWQMHNLQISAPAKHGNIRFEQRDQLTLPSAVGPETSALPRPRHMDFLQLYHYIGDLEHAGLSVGAYKYALQRKFSAPFACLLMVFLAAALCIGVGDRNKNISVSLAVSISLGLLFYIIGNTGHLLAGSERLPAAFAAWLPTLVFGGLATFLLLKNEGY